MILTEAWRLSSLPVAVLAAACLQEPPESSRGRQKSVSPERPPENMGHRSRPFSPAQRTQWLALPRGQQWEGTVH